jgi:hypothetical protein
MMIVIVHNAETQQAQMVSENLADPELAVKLLRGFADGIEQQATQQAAQNNGHQRRPSGLIIPPTIVPRDVVDPTQQQP